jgi:hypothetical protein
MYFIAHSYRELTLLRTADILSDLALILLPIRLVRGIRDKRLRWRLFFIFSTSSMSLSPLYFSRDESALRLPVLTSCLFNALTVVTTIVSLVHAAYIIDTGGTRVLIAALVEDCMSLTVANLPIVATAFIRRLSGVSSCDNNFDGDGQRGSSFKFRSWSCAPGGATTATANWTVGFGSDGSSKRGDTVVGDLSN